MTLWYFLIRCARIMYYDSSSIRRDLMGKDIELYIFYFYKVFSLNSISNWLSHFPWPFEGKGFVFSFTSLSGFFSKHFPSPLTVQNRCRCWPAPRTLLLYHDSTIPHGHSHAKVENYFNPEQYLCCSQPSISPKELILFAGFFFFFISVYAENCSTLHFDDL